MQQGPGFLFQKEGKRMGRREGGKEKQEGVKNKKEGKEKRKGERRKEAGKEGKKERRTQKRKYIMGNERNEIRANGYGKLKY